MLGLIDYQLMLVGQRNRILLMNFLSADEVSVCLSGAIEGKPASARHQAVGYTAVKSS